MPIHDGVFQLYANQKVSQEFELYKRISAEVMEHQKTREKGVDLLRKLKDGEVTLDQVVTTDDGWQVVPARPPSQEQNDDE